MVREAAASNRLTYCRRFISVAQKDQRRDARGMAPMAGCAFARGGPCSVKQPGISIDMKASLSSIRFSLPIKVVIGILLFCPSWHLDAGMCGDVPTSAQAGIQSDDPDPTAEPEFNLGAWFASSVWRHISAVDGDRCPSEPTCSSYSVEAFRKHGFFIGWMMTVDRLIHEADEGRWSPLVRRDGEFKIFDPVENNDFWWCGQHGKDRD